MNHGFVQSRDHKFASFDPSESIFTYPCEETCLAPDGTVVGLFEDTSSNIHGFLRTPDGHIATIDAPAAFSAQGTVAASINPEGVITGYSVDSGT
jgi:hypothetical protein